MAPRPQWLNGRSLIFIRALIGRFKFYPTGMTNQDQYSYTGTKSRKGIKPREFKKEQEILDSD
jgi:hypothetical protein